jgi:glycosyltransferase involved in cell wall biosynthesis
MSVGDNSRLSRSTMPSRDHPNDSADVLILVTAYNEADRIAATLAALAGAFPGAAVWVADDGSTDSTARIAAEAGATVVSSGRMVGKGGAASLACEQALAQLEAERDLVVLLCDADLGDSASGLAPLVRAVGDGQVELAVAAFSKRVGGGVGAAVGFAGWAIRRCCGLELQAPISGQRAIGVETLVKVLPFAHGFGMEIGMTIDAARAGARVEEIELDLHHRATGRTLSGFMHRGRQLLDFVRVYLARR